MLTRKNQNQKLFLHPFAIPSTPKNVTTNTEKCIHKNLLDNENVKFKPFHTVQK